MSIRRVRIFLSIGLDKLMKRTQLSLTDTSKELHGRSASLFSSMKNWLQKPSQDSPPTSYTTRLILSSKPPICEGAASNYLDKLMECDEIVLMQTEHRAEEGQYNSRIEYKYNITSGDGTKLFTALHAYETGPPKFDLKFIGEGGQLIVIHKLLQNLSSRLLSMQIMCPGGQYIGSIEQNILLSLENPPVFELRDSRDEIRAVVQSDFTKSGLGLKRDVKILTPDYRRVLGKISKRWGGFGDNLSVSFELTKEVDSSSRVALVALCILMSQRYTK